MADIIRFPVIARPIPAIPAQPLPEYLRGWTPYLAVVESDDDEALPIRGHATDDGPMIVFNPLYVALGDIEEWGIAALWLSPCLVQIAGTVLAEALAAEDGIGRFNSPRWTAFRNAIEEATGQVWDHKGPHKASDGYSILEAARREGLDFMADHIVAALLIETDLADYLAIA
jgi:hypothetical protein